MTEDLSNKIEFSFLERFLACQKKGVEFGEEEAELFSKSWEKSRDTTARLFNFVKSMTPHETKKTLSLNEARNFIIAMSKPMGEAVQLIEMNLKKVELTKKLVKQDNDEIEKFQERFHFTGYERDITDLEYPRTVCAHEDCKDYEYVGQSREGHSSKIQAEIKQKTSVKEQKEALIRELEKRIKENKEEREFIYKCASHFGAFLKRNAIIPYNDAFSDYLDMLIKEEQEKEKEIRDDKRIKQLKKDKVSYEEQKKAIIEQTSSPTHSIGTHEIETKNIYEMKDQLCALKHNGDTLKKALGTVISVNRCILVM